MERRGRDPLRLGIAERFAVTFLQEGIDLGHLPNHVDRSSIERHGTQRWLHAVSLPKPGIGIDQRDKMRPCRMAHQNQSRRIAAPFAGLGLHECRGPGDMAGLREGVGSVANHRIVDRNEDESFGNPARHLVRRHLRAGFVPDAPSAAMHHQDDRGFAIIGCFLRQEDIELLQGLAAVRQIDKRRSRPGVPAVRAFLQTVHLLRPFGAALRATAHIGQVGPIRLLATARRLALLHTLPNTIT